MENINLESMKQVINDTKKNKVINRNANELRLTNLINLVNLGLISKEDVIVDSVYQLYIESVFVGEEVGKKSLVK